MKDIKLVTVSNFVGCNKAPNGTYITLTTDKYYRVNFESSGRAVVCKIDAVDGSISKMDNNAEVGILFQDKIILLSDLPDLLNKKETNYETNNNSDDGKVIKQTFSRLITFKTGE